MKAHIINQPGHEVGDKALALCGKKWKVKVLWADVSDDTPICRDCVDSAVRALTASTNQVRDMTVEVLRVLRTANRALDVATEPNDATIIVELTEAYAERRQEKADEKQRLADARALVAEADERKASKKADKERPPIAPEAPDSSEVTIEQPEEEGKDDRGD